MNRLLALMLGTTLLISGAVIPRQSPEFQINLAGGKQLMLSSYKGKPLVLEFLLTTCPHCQATSQTLEKLYQQYKSRGLAVLGVAINDNGLKLTPDFIQKLQLTYTVGAAPNEQALFYLQHPPILVPYMPQLVFIDKKGVIQAQYAGNDKFFAEAGREKNIRTEIENLLNPKATKPRAGISGKSSQKSKNSK